MCYYQSLLLPLVSSSVSQPGLWIAGVEKPGSHQRKARDFAPESSACSLLSQVFSSGSCGCCSTTGQHRWMLFLCCREGGSCFLWQLRRRGSFQTGCLLARVLLASGPQRAARFFYHGKLTRRPGAAEEPYSAHMLIRRGYSLFLLCKKERAVPELTTRFLSQQLVFHK